MKKMNIASSPDVEDAAGIVVYGYFYERQLLAAILITVAVLGTIGNCFVIIAVGLSKKLRTTTNVFVVNLAVADVATCLFTPWQAVAILGGDGWPIPRATWVCTAAAFVVVVTIGCSVNNLALIAVNRWVGITKSRSTTHRIYTARKLALMVIFSWTIPLACALTPVLTDIGELGYEVLYKSCTWVRSNPHTETYNLIIAAVYYPIQLCLITASYLSIFYYVRKTSRATIEAVRGDKATKKKVSKRQLEVTKNLIYVVLAFVFCFTPYFISLVASADWSYRLVPWGATIVLCNSSANPIIYATSHPDFKEIFGYLIRCRKIPHSGQGNRSRTNTLTFTGSSVNQEYSVTNHHRV
ncbi:melanopsin-A-like [Patiria miniata]|uniref:G-protein coupled receptors family 1 profile domain-containing protein n=1 Tax=Patiria miniata TaxID=46514 RepID=A0A913Z1D3_PATMI|nr:melanopsin-A-like [Patiria miniata]